MEFFRIKKDIPFMRHALIFNAISALTFGRGRFLLVAEGIASFDRIYRWHGDGSLLLASCRYQAGA